MTPLKHLEKKKKVLVGLGIVELVVRNVLYLGKCTPDLDAVCVNIEWWGKRYGYKSSHMSFMHISNTE